MSTEDNKAIAGRWLTEFCGAQFNPAVIDELAVADIRFEYSLHAPCRGRNEVRQFATKFRPAFPRTQTGAAFDDSQGRERLITKEIGLDDGVTVSQQLGLITDQTCRSP